MTSPKVEKQRQIAYTAPAAANKATASKTTAPLFIRQNSDNDNLMGLQVERGVNKGGNKRVNSNINATQEVYLQSGRKIVIQKLSDGRSVRKYYSADGKQLKPNYFKKLEGEVKVSADGKTYTTTKAGETKTYKTKTAGEAKIAQEQAKLNKIKKEQGFIGKSWDAIKNNVWPFTYCDSSNNAQKQIDAEKKLLKQILNGKVSKSYFKEVTGLDCTQANIQKFKNGKLNLKSSEKVSAYREGQEMAIDVVGDVAAGIGAGIAIAAAPVTGGASLALAVAVGAGTKAGLKYLDAKSGGKEYNTFAKDCVTGGIAGLLTPVTMGAGGAVGNVTTKFVSKFAGAKATSLATFVAREGVVGGIYGGVMEGGTEAARQIRNGINGDGVDVGKVFTTTVEGFGGGALAGVLMNGGIKGLNKITKNITNSKKVGNISHINTSKSLNFTHGTAVLEAPQLVPFESLNLKNVFVKIPKLDPLNINENALCLVHMSDFGPSAGKIMSVRDAMGASRNSVHFTLNHPVESHRLGSWEKCKFAYIMPYKATKEANAAGKIIEGLPHDLYTNGSVTIPEGSVIVKYNKNIESGKVLVSTDKNLSGVKIIETSDDVYGTVNNVIEKMGYTKATPDNVGGFSSRTLTKETITEDLTTECQAWMDFCKTQGIKPMQHAYSPNACAEQIIESLDMLAQTNMWKGGNLKEDYKKLMLEAITAIRKRVKENGYSISINLDKLEEIISKSYSPRIALYRVKKQLGIKPLGHTKRKLFSKYNDYSCTIDSRTISPDKRNEQYDFFLSDKADANSEFITGWVEWLNATHR